MNNNESTFTTRVNEQMAKTGVRQKDIVQATGMSQGHVSHICLGRIKKVEAGLIFPLADALKCEARWLAMGSEE